MKSIRLFLYDMLCFKTYFIDPIVTRSITDIFLRINLGLNGKMKKRFSYILYPKAETDCHSHVNIQKPFLIIKQYV